MSSNNWGLVDWSLAIGDWMGGDNNRKGNGGPAAASGFRLSNRGRTCNEKRKPTADKSQLRITANQLQIRTWNLEFETWNMKLKTTTPACSQHHAP